MSTMTHRVVPWASRRPSASVTSHVLTAAVRLLCNVEPRPTSLEVPRVTGWM